MNEDVSKNQPSPKDQTEDAKIKDLAEDGNGLSIEDKAAKNKLIAQAHDAIEDANTLTNASKKPSKYFPAGPNPVYLPPAKGPGEDMLDSLKS